MQLLPEHASCPNCGSTSAKRWRSYSGIELCTDCEWDYFSELNGRKLLDARQATQPKILPTASGTAKPIRHKSPETNPVGRTSQRLGAGGLDAVGRVLGSATGGGQPRDHVLARKWKQTLDELVTPAYNSICLLCGQIFYGAAMSSCSRCGGMCRLVSDHDMQLMGRHGQRLVEAERG